MLYKLSNDTDVKGVIESLGADFGGVKIMSKKGQRHLFMLKGIKTPAANILKQDALAIGAELAVPSGVIVCETETVDALLICDQTQLEFLTKKERAQPFGLKAVAEALQEYIPKPPRRKPQVMGVFNINQDSFYDESRVDEAQFLARARKMIHDGATIIDIGGVSSRPGSSIVPPEYELSRVKGVIDTIYREKLHEEVLFSIDSYTPLVIEYALKHGFGLVNDITGLENNEVCRLAAEFEAKVCIMHMQGTPQTMQHNPKYETLIPDIDRFFKERIEKAKGFGIKEIILDTGIGFGKTLEHNLMLIKHQSNFLKHGYPLLVGASRKSMIDKIYPSATEERLSGTLAIHLKAIDEGASIIRAHDVPEHVQAIAVHQAIKDAGV